MKRYGVLVVDDSAVIRKVLIQLIENDSHFFVLGYARNGEDALEKIKRLKPDVVTLDIEMPVMDGMETLKIIMREHPVPVVMISQPSLNEAETTLHSIELGAIDFFLKEELLENQTKESKLDFLQRLRVAAEAKVKGRAIEKEVPVLDKKSNLATLKRNNEEFDLLFIGTSTGGPSALQEILTRFPEEFHLPILVVQHMPPGFTKPLADRLNSLCQMRVKEAEEGEELKAGTIYICPAGLQTTIQQQQGSGKKLIRLSTKSPITTLYKPSVDVTLLSMVQIYKGKLLTVILTGMGVDGTLGCEQVKRSGGTVLVESEETCVVYGMPKSVYEAGLADKQVSLTRMYDTIIQCLDAPKRKN